MPQNILTHAMKLSSFFVSSLCNFRKKVTFEQGFFTASFFFLDQMIKSGVFSCWSLALFVIKGAKEKESLTHSRAWTKASPGPYRLWRLPFQLHDFLASLTHNMVRGVPRACCLWETPNLPLENQTEFRDITEKTTGCKSCVQVFSGTFQQISHTHTQKSLQKTFKS